jgi:hypothetical protein
MPAQLAPFAWIPRACGLLLLIALLLGPAPGAQAKTQAGSAAPAITLDPASGPCPASITARGSGFAPGVAVNFLIQRDRDGAITGGNSVAGGPPAEADGTFERKNIPILGCGPDEPIGATYTVIMYEYRGFDIPSHGPEARATFTVTAPGLPNTGGGRAMTPDRPLLLAALVLVPFGVWLTLRRRHAVARRGGRARR